MKRGVLSWFSVCFLFFLYFVHDSSVVLMGEKMRKMLEQKVKRDKKTNSRQLRMSDYCKMTNKEAMGLFLCPVCVFLFLSPTSPPQPLLYCDSVYKFCVIITTATTELKCINVTPPGLLVDAVCTFLIIIMDFTLKLAVPCCIMSFTKVNS